MFGLGSQAEAGGPHLPGYICPTPVSSLRFPPPFPSLSPPVECPNPPPPPSSSLNPTPTRHRGRGANEN